MLFYLVVEKESKARFCATLHSDKPCQRLLPGLPLSYLAYYLQPLFPDDSNYIEVHNIIEFKRQTIAYLQQGLRKDNATQSTLFYWVDQKIEQGQLSASAPEEWQIDALLEITRGRQISEKEWPALARKQGMTTDIILQIMDQIVAAGNGEWVPAVKRTQTGWLCSRCSNTEPQEWPAIYGVAATCEACQALGAATSLQAIYRGFRPQSSRRADISDSSNVKNNEWQIELTTAQIYAASLLQEYIVRQKVKEVLIWAACGAGKTEVAFPLIKEYVSRQKRVLFAAPRQDVVHDIYPRLLSNFPELKITLLSGAVLPEFREDDLTVATTHQVLKFYRCFDLILFDEMDAYPYQGCTFLEQGLRMALTEKGQIVYLTATPSNELVNKVSKGLCKVIRIPVRHHGQPLPVPQIIHLPLMLEYPHQVKNAEKANYHLKKLLAELIPQGPVLIFVPIVALVGVWTQSLKESYPHLVVEGSWSSDPDRREKVKALQQQQVDIFITTSILERGITVSKVQVIILYADHAIYDVRSLVQMAGRAGRTTECPSGSVIFAGAKSNHNMLSAKQWIEEQNSIARQVT